MCSIGHYTTWLISPSIIGLVVFVESITIENSADTALIPYFGLFMALWGTYVLNFVL